MKWTKISLIHNIDGCHTMTSFKCYMNCDPFTALSILMSDYYIQSYCGEELYHMAYVGYRYALQIDEVDIDDDTLYQFYKMNDDKVENYIPINPEATEIVAGMMKLYQTSGNNTDGTMSQKAITEGVNAIKFELDGQDKECLILDLPWD